MKKQLVASLLFGAGLMTGLSSVSWAQSNNQTYLLSKGEVVHHNNSFARPSRLSTIPNVKIGGSPTAIWFKGKVYLAHKGENNNNNIYYTTCDSSNCTDGNKWMSEQMIFPNQAATTESPALGIYQNTLYLVHKGVGNNNNIYYTTCDGSKDCADVNNWTQEKIVEGPSNSKPQMTGTPALMEFKGKLYLVHRGTKWGSYTGNELWYTTYDQKTGQWSSDTPVRDKDKNLVKTSDSPALAVYDDGTSQKLYLAYNQNSQPWNMTFDEKNGWSDPKLAADGVAMVGSPALMAGYDYVSTSNVLYIAVHGRDNKLMVAKCYCYIPNNWTDGVPWASAMSNSPALTSTDGGKRMLGAYTGTDNSANVFDYNLNSPDSSLLKP